MRVQVHAPDEREWAERALARVGAANPANGADLDRLIGEGDPAHTSLVIFTEELAALFLAEGRAPALPAIGSSVIGFLGALTSLPRSLRAGAAVLSCGGFDQVAVMAGSAAEAELGARMIGGTSQVLDARATDDEIWDRLGEALRRARTLLAQTRIHAAAVALRGRGRIAGPVNPDLLIRFGVSAFR